MERKQNVYIIETEGKRIEEQVAARETTDQGENDTG